MQLAAPSGGVETEVLVVVTCFSFDSNGKLGSCSVEAFVGVGDIMVEALGSLNEEGNLMLLEETGKGRLG